jgi:hypothetical protein
MEIQISTKGLKEVGLQVGLVKKISLFLFKSEAQFGRMR